MRLREAGNPADGAVGFGNYVPTSLPDRYDAFLFFDRTSALNPLGQGFNHADITETWPQGM